MITHLAQRTQQLSHIARLKRFLETGRANPSFKQQVQENLAQTIADYQLNIAPEELTLLSAQGINYLQSEEVIASETLNDYREFFQEQLRWCYELINLAHASSNPKFKAWRLRQIARANSELGASDPPVLHAPVSFELSKGCSVGCWFCGVSAPKLSDIFFYTEENASLWRDVLVLLKDLIGPSVGAGFCYCASDPLDNPDYEKLCRDFHDILGVFPQTTTAQPLKNPDRTRTLLQLSQELGCLVNRFSIISLKTLEQLYAEFTPEELAGVQLVLQNPETGKTKSFSGRARRKAPKQAELEDDFAGSTACVTGFLFNMVDRSVKLISPCNADNRWANGYRIYQEGTFTNVQDLKTLLESMIESQMSLELKESEIIRFRRDLEYQPLDDGFQISSRFTAHKLRNKPHLKQLGELINQGSYTTEDIIKVFVNQGLEAHKIKQSLSLLFNHGIIDDEPQL